jgi:ankyrin repeat protein
MIAAAVCVAAASPVHHKGGLHEGHLARFVHHDGTESYVEANAPPLSPKCRHETRREEMAQIAEEARLEAQGGTYNDPTFPTIIKNGQSLEFATYNEGLIHMDKMLEDGVDINSRDSHGMTAIHYNYKHPELVDWLHERGADLNARGAKGRTCLHLISRDYGERLHDANKLLDLNADPNVTDDEGMTPLLITCQMHNKSGVSRISIVRNLLNGHADPGVANADGNAIHHALWAAVQDAEKDPDKPAILRTLLEGDKDCINVGTPGTMIEHRAESDCNTPLQRACNMDSHAHPSYGLPDPECLKNVCAYLISHKADYRGPDGEGVPPRRRVRSEVMRRFFNDASKVSVPGSPAKFST